MKRDLPLAAAARSLHALRDRMQDWDELLDASIRGKQCSANTIHLEAMASVAGHFKAVLEPLAGALDPDRWADCCGDGAGLCRGEGGKCDTLFDLRPRIRLGPV